MSASGSDNKKGRSFGRRYIQLLTAVLYNCNFRGFAEGSIYKGDIKGICVPGLNCYSCPGAIGSCPLGSLQSGLLSSQYRIPYYVAGTLLLFGIMLGRVVCGFLCPFGLIQDLLYKIPTPKIRKNSITSKLTYLKYLILVVFVIIIPLTALVPGFCKYICPAGTLQGGIPLVLKNEALRELTGFLFTWKTILLTVIIISCVICFRSFCRFLCPLGAIYSLFNRLSVFGIRVNEKTCTGCDRCIRNCRMDVKKVCDRECIQCGDCIKDCPVNAIGYGRKQA